MTGLVVIGGPSASGKSALALRLAEALGGVIVNADSMQLYRELPLLTARPSAGRRGARAAPPLRRARRRRSGVGRALARARRPARSSDGLAAGRLPIVVGGTGPLSARRCCTGSRRCPRCRPRSARAAAEARLGARRAGPARRARAARPGDGGAPAPERPPAPAARASRCCAATGRSLAAWQAEPALRRRACPQPVRRRRAAAAAPRSSIARIERRLQAMVEAGALAELARAARRAPGPRICRCSRRSPCRSCSPISRAASSSPRRSRARIARTRQYAKRQITWLRHQLPELQPLHGFGDELEALPGGGAAGAPLVDRCRYARIVSEPPRSRDQDRPTKGQAKPAERPPRHRSRSLAMSDAPSVTATAHDVQRPDADDDRLGGRAPGAGRAGGRGGIRLSRRRRPADLRRDLQAGQDPPHPGPPRAGRGARRRGLRAQRPAGSAWCW